MCSGIMSCFRTVFFVFLSAAVFCHVSAIWYNALDALKPQVSADVQVNAVHDLLGRLLPDPQRTQFVLAVDPTLNTENETVVVEKGQEESTIQITGTSGVAVAFGIQAYLKNCCNIHISWDGNQLSLPQIIPVPAERSVMTSVGWFNYFNNVCTLSYSSVWWNWTRWEQHIDWMALNGINLPLATVGEELIWRNVFMKMGLSQQDTDAYFTGPAFLAWNRMGNLKKWGGPLSKSWHAQQFALEQLILKRMVSLGMTPVLPAFAGHVPDAMIKLYPNASITPLGGWAGFDCDLSCTMFVDPTDPLFQQIGSLFMSEMKNAYGLYHAYSADPFNEMTPKSFEPNYVNAVGKGIYKAMAEVDSQAVWVMQAWMFVGTPQWRDPAVTAALTSSVPLGNLLFLDLYSEQTPIYPLVNSYDGQPFIWCMLHNFGGKDGLYGSVQLVNDGLYEAVQYPNSSLVGTGLTMEGIYQNYPIYEMALDLFWSPEAQPMDQISWVKNMATRRYGKNVEAIQTAWELLWTGIYNCTSDCDDYSNQNPVITSSPTFGIFEALWYDGKSVCDAWKNFVDESQQFVDSDLYRRDLVDVTRQILQLIGDDMYLNMTDAYTYQDIDDVRLYGDQLIELMTDLDRLLNADVHFLLGLWVGNAKQMAGSKSDRALFEYNAKNQLTLWGPNGEILDYARKQWAGLMNDYYKQRWILFVDTILGNLANGTEFDQDKFNNDVFNKVETPFCNSHAPYLACTTGDSVDLAKKVFDKYNMYCEQATDVRRKPPVENTNSRYAKQIRKKFVQ